MQQTNKYINPGCDRFPSPRSCPAERPRRPGTRGGCAGRGGPRLGGRGISPAFPRNRAVPFSPPFLPGSVLFLCFIRICREGFFSPHTISEGHPPPTPTHPILTKSYLYRTSSHDLFGWNYLYTVITARCASLAWEVSCPLELIEIKCLRLR